MSSVVAVNGRFLTQPITGVQRYAREALANLPAGIAEQVVVVHPDGSVRRVHELSAVAVPSSASMSRLAGHAWEQVVLPRAARRLRADVILGLANSGPLAVEAQVVVLHDVAPLLHPDLFDANYVRLARVLLPRLARRARRVVTVSEASRRDLMEHLRVHPERLDVVPPGVSLPVDAADPAERRRVSGGEERAGAPRGPSCLFVGGHDPRKNLDFLLQLWPRLNRDTGASLRVTYRSASRAHEAVHRCKQPGVEWIADPSDAALGALYRDADVLLWPSVYEGFGMPLLEAMAHGTPFLSTDVGAARELALGPDQVLPLDADRWHAAVTGLRGEQRGASSDACRRKAATYSWQRTGELLATALGRAVG